MSGIADEFVAERLVMDFNRPEAAMERLACQDVVQHLPASVMEDAPAAIRRHGTIENHERTLREERIAGIFFRPDNEIEWNFMVLGIEVTSDGDQPRSVGVKQLFEQEPDLERLASATYRR